MSKIALFYLSVLAVTIFLGGCSSGGSDEIPDSTADLALLQTPVLSYASYTDVAATNEASLQQTRQNLAADAAAADAAAAETAAADNNAGQITPSTAEDQDPPVPGTTSPPSDLNNPDGDSSPTPGGTAENQQESSELPSPSSPTATSTPPSTPEPVDPTIILGVPVESIAFLPDAVVNNSREIFIMGRSLGRDSQAFSKLGDSLIANPHFLTGFDDQRSDLGPYDFLQPALDHFAGSYERYGVAIHAGLHSWGIFDPMWADKNWCEPNETMVACEFRLNNPSVLLILLGSNDAGAPDSFAFNLRKLVEFSMENGVIPVLVTKADRFEGPENTNNIIIERGSNTFDAVCRI